jgi:zinc/manganese transport system permease protein
MNELYDALFAPFIEFAFMRRALIATFTLSLGCAPVGVLLVLRRMSLMGDALSHAILPGVAVGFLIAGFSITAMTVGGLVAGLIVAFLAGIISRTTNLKEDATFAAFFIISLALGVMIVSLKGNNVDLMHVLFGTVLAVDDHSMMFIASVTTATLFVLAMIYRALIVECFDPNFLKSVSGSGGLFHAIFLILVVMNLVAAFQTLGTLMALGLLMLPSITASLWGRSIGGIFIIAVVIAIFSSYLGLIFSYHYELPSGPSIILVTGIIYLFSLIFGKQGGLMKKIYYKKVQ